jgi:hypothetical protein
LLEALLLAGGLNGLPVSARVDGERAVERARYRFVIGATQPFDDAYPRSVFEKKVAREIDEERVLRKVFGMSLTPQLLSDELERIEKDTKAPDQWAAIKRSLGNDRRRIEEVFCRPLVVERALRARFAFDQRIHAGPHQAAREVRARFLAGERPPGAAVSRIARGAQAPGTDALLRDAKEKSAVPRCLAPPETSKQDAPVAVDPEMAAVLERELRKPGDVTTILEERDRFSVFRLIEKTQDAWKVEAVTFPKVDFDIWFEKVRTKPSG